MQNSQAFGELHQDAHAFQALVSSTMLGGSFHGIDFQDCTRCIRPGCFCKNPANPLFYHQFENFPSGRPVTGQGQMSVTRKRSSEELTSCEWPQLHPIGGECRAQAAGAGGSVGAAETDPMECGDNAVVPSPYKVARVDSGGAAADISDILSNRCHLSER